jgi:hypothetical protein
VPYEIRWTVTSSHCREVSDEEFARLKGRPVAEIARMGDDDLIDGLADELADLDDDGFEHLTRDDIEVTRR